MAKKYHFSYVVLEQAERMREKLRFYESELYNDKDLDTDSFKKRALELKSQIDELSEALDSISGQCGSPMAPWKQIEILKKYASQRDMLDCLV